MQDSHANNMLFIAIRSFGIEPVIITTQYKFNRERE